MGDEDQSHPGPLARIEMGRAVAAIIQNYNGMEATPVGEATLPPTTTRAPVDLSDLLLFDVDDLVSVNGQEPACIATNPQNVNGLLTINYFDGTLGEEIHITELTLVEKGGCVGITITEAPEEEEYGGEGEGEGDQEEEYEDEEEEGENTSEPTTYTSRLLTTVIPTEPVEENPSRERMQELKSMYQRRPNFKRWTAIATFVDVVLEEYPFMQERVAKQFGQQQSIFQREYTKKLYKKAKKAFKRARKIMRKQGEL